MRKSIILIFILALLLPITVNAEKNYLYDVLKNEVESNGLAREYTGEHHDSFIKEPSKKIYHWYAENDGEANLVLEKNNLIFGDFCWQMIRTTDTGGVKLIYNGIPNDGKCNNTGSDASIGTSSFNTNSNSLSDVGYMYNARYPVDSKNSNYYRVLEAVNKSTRNWYADSITWNNTENKWELDNPYQISSESDYSTLVGKYTLGNSSETYKSEKAYYIAKNDDNYFHCIKMTNGNDLSYYNNSFTYGDSYTDNNGTYTIENPTTIQALDVIDNEDFEKKYVCKNAINNTCSEVWFANNTNNMGFTYYSSNNQYIFSNSFTYDNERNVYVLNNDRISFWNQNDKIETKELKNHHYTCWNSTGECNNISYVYYYDDIYGGLNYINISDGKSIETAINEMLYDDNVNTNNSPIKTVVDNWYQNNLVDYTEYLEDTIYCNNRVQSNSDNNGWNPNTGIPTNTLSFGFSSYKLKCINDTDKFSVNNPKAKLTYPVGLMTLDEMHMIGFRLAKTGESYWTIEPDYFNNNNSNNNYIPDTGGVGSSLSNSVYGVRPAISLKSKMRYLTGTGSKNNPYIVDLTNYYGIDVEIKNETEDLTVEINDLSQVEEGETVNFKVTPIKGHKVTSIKIIDEESNEVEYNTSDNKNFVFTMPSSDVTIIPSYERVKNAVNVEDNKNTKEFVIEVNDSKAVVYEDTVKFRVEPETGYEVEKIDITDKDNNKINYKKTSNKNEYEFIMPDTDVLIKPYYRLISSNNGLPNPNTKRQILLIAISIIIIGIITTLFIKKKKRLT